MCIYMELSRDYKWSPPSAEHHLTFDAAVSVSPIDSCERSLHRCLYDELLLQCGVEGFPLLAVQAAEPLYRPAVEGWCFTDDRFSAPLLHVWNGAYPAKKSCESWSRSCHS